MTRWEIAAAWLRYKKDRLRYRWRLVTGRCPDCPKRRHGPHKFGCHRRGAGFVVHHIDGDARNNDPANLEIVDPKENGR